MVYKPGPKELQARAMREANYENALKKSKKPSTSELRNKIAKIKGGGKPKKGGGRGR